MDNNTIDLPHPEFLREITFSNILEMTLSLVRDADVCVIGTQLATDPETSVKNTLDHPMSTGSERDTEDETSPEPYSLRLTDSYQSDHYITEQTPLCWPRPSVQLVSLSDLKHIFTMKLTQYFIVNITYKSICKSIFM